MKLASQRILLLNPPHTAIGSRVPDDHLPPLGLLSIGGPLLDAGFAVELLDADLAPLGAARLRHSPNIFGVPDPNAGVLAGFGAVFRRVAVELNQLA